MSWWRPNRAAVMTAALGAVAGFLACSENSNNQAASENELPDEIVTEFVTIETDSGRVQWRLSAPVARRFNQKQVYDMDNPRIEFYDERGVLKSTLVSKKGEYSQDTHDMLAYGDVVGTSVEGDVLETDSLRYLNTEDKIVSDSFVKVTRGNDVMTGWGLEADNELSSLEIKRDVKATIVDDEGKIDE